MRNLLHFSFGIIFVLVTIGCSANNQDTQDAVTGVKNRVKWSNIPAEFHPQMTDITLNTSSVDTLKLNIFGFAADVEVVYSENVPAGQGFLRAYRVSKTSGALAPIVSSVKAKTISLSGSGDYSCRIQITNGKITELDGTCYVRLQVMLPTNSELSVYNLNQLVSTKSKLITTDEFLIKLQKTTWVGDKRVALNDFLESYSKAGKNPAFTSAQVGIAIREFDLTADKLKVLRRLHGFVSDRENLNSMINQEFPEHARGEARVIAGIN
ncbi:DUF4476 domain-containing protein [Bdellovibrio sp. SKB1291214]|uniref:DUF4476 domain-containing protein n=1 Tax=Bdellovibrio sp. SKB1291214 TaxID=1732569 RepID=UPI000B51610A|nr:DUF4476 domain-containing protein [Bdellovibrio sp. SKB1291214]UYL10037.1 DUF4476 domain-containing protein [Bdellovibrio sp. SKB1291214]